MIMYLVVAAGLEAELLEDLGGERPHDWRPVPPLVAGDADRHARLHLRENANRARPTQR